MRLLQLGARIIEQDDAVKAEVARRISSGTSPKFEQEASAFGEESLEGNGFRAVFVLASAFIPKGGLVIGAFVIANRRGISHVFG